MAPPTGSAEAPEPDWLALCRRAAEGVRAAVARYPSVAERARTTGRGEGGDLALVIDRAAEDAVFAELEAAGVPLTVVSEERGEVALGGGGGARVVVDPIDGSLNAKRGLPFDCVSIAIAAGDTMADVEFGYVAALHGGGGEWWARRGGGAFRDGERLAVAPGPDGRIEVLAIESAHPRNVAAAAEALVATGAARLRALGAIAMSLCLVAGGEVDAMVSLWPCRSVDAAAGQLIVREAGGTATFPDAAGAPLGAGLGLDMRSRVMAAARPEALAELERAVTAPGGRE